jgi:autoinducer 2-degrading protein
MITRIVKMSFKKDETDSFVRIFYESNPLLHGCEGCLDVKLLKDHKDPSIIFTLSLWESLNDLEVYRNSQLFKSTWAKTKVLFNAKAEAWSLGEVKSE